MFLFLCLSLFTVMIQPSSFAQAAGLSFGITPLKKPIGLDDKKVKLGKRLFHDVRLSKNNSISCAHCHGLDTGGVDNLKHSFGVDGAEGGINTPTVYNSGLNLAQFWDGRAASLEEQVNGPTHNPIEMASNWNEIIGKLRMDPHLMSKDFNNCTKQRGLPLLM